MTEKLPTLGTAVDDGAPIIINVEELIGSDICIVANKGAGKSGMMRVLFEQTHGIVRQILLDPEGEFHTLGEVGDYLICGGPEAQVPATIANAAVLARTLAENPGISAVIQLDHLKPWEQEEFVGLFLEALMDAPRETWHPMLLGIDETHRFAPQDGNVASSAAMRDIIGRGRKRGITPVFATYRVAAIDKNVTAGSPTWFLGRVGQEIDRKAAAMALGFTPSSADAKDISFLPKRRFWTYGSATAPRPVLFDVADARTTMTKAGQAMAPVPPAPKSLQKLVQALSKAAAPQTAPEAEKGAPDAPTADLEAIRAQADKEGYQRGVEVGHAAGFAEGHDKVLDDMMTILQGWRARHGRGDIAVGVDDRDIDICRRDEPIAAEPEPQPQKKPRRAPAPRADGELSEGANSLIQAARQAHRQVSWTEAAFLAGRAPHGGSMNTIRKELREAGWDEPPANDLAAEGLFLTVDEIRAKMSNSFSGATRAVFDCLWDHGPLTKAEIAQRLDRAPHGGSWNTIWKALRNSPRVHESDGRWDIAVTLRELASLPRT